MVVTLVPYRATARCATVADMTEPVSPGDSEAAARWLAALADVAAPPDTAAITAGLRAHLASLPGGACPFCLGSSWEPAVWGHFMMGDHVAPIGSVPAVALTCAGCGFLAMMRADKIPTPRNGDEENQQCLPFAAKS